MNLHTHNGWLKKQIILIGILLLTILFTITQSGLIGYAQRWILLLGIVICGIVYVAIPWEKLQELADLHFDPFININRLLSRILLLLSPIVSFYIVQVYGGCTDRNFIKLLLSLKGACNLALYYSLGYFLYLLCNRANYTALFLTLLSSTFGLANNLVMEFRSSPILAADLGSIGTAMDVAGNYEYNLTPASLKALIITVVFCCVLLRQKSYRWLKWKKRAIVLAGSALIYAALTTQFFSGTFFRKNGISLSVWNPSSNYVKNGSLVSLALSYSYYHVTKPDDYSIRTVQDLAARYPSDVSNAAQTPQANVIAIMNESFSDLGILGNLDISEDVMPFVHNLSENTVKGTLYMSVRTSQTANSEFEFLTGCSMAFLPYRSIPYNSYIKDSMPSLTTTLKDLGYGGNLAFHPGEANAWNRDKLYPLLGFDTFCSFQNIAADLGEEDIVHGFPSDQFGYEYLINQYEQFRLKSAEPFYSFFVTIQNHGGYTKNPVDVVVSLNNKEQWSEETEQYLNLIKLSDTALEYLINYFKQVEEPTVILMFGDHQPGISPTNEAKTYSSNLDLYAVPYLIWANYDIEEEEIDMSANYLSSYLLKILDADMPGFNKYLLDLQERIPVITANGYVGDDGKLHGWEDETAYTTALNEYRILQYNNLFDSDHRVNDFFYLDK